MHTTMVVHDIPCRASKLLLDTVLKIIILYHVPLASMTGPRVHCLDLGANFAPCSTHYVSMADQWGFLEKHFNGSAEAKKVLDFSRIT